MATLDFQIDGVSLQNYAFNIQNRSGRWRAPGKRGANITLPGVHGTSYVSGKPYEENSLVLTMWAVGADTNGVVAADMQAKVRDNLDTLLRIFSSGRLLQIRQTVNGSIRECYGEVVQSVDISSMAGATRAEFGVEITVPKAFWRDTADTSQTLIVGAVTDVTSSFTSFSASTGPLTEMVYKVTGPATNPILTNPATGQWVKYVGGLTAGQIWTVNSADWTSIVGASTNVIADTQHGNGATFLDLSPSATGPQIRFQASATTAATAVTVQGKNSYLIA